MQYTAHDERLRAWRIHGCNLKSLLAPSDYGSRMLACGRLATSVLMIATPLLGVACGEKEEPIRSALVYVAAQEDASTAIAGFLGDGYGANRCLSDNVDRCTITTCLDGGGVQTYRDGGAVELRGEAGLDVVLDTGAVKDADGHEKPGLAIVHDLPRVSEKETVTMVVRGHGAVPRVESSVELSERLELTDGQFYSTSCQSQALEAADAMAVDATSEFTVQWSSDGDDAVEILFLFDEIKDYAADEDRERSTTIRCSYTAGEGQATIPEEVVEMMPHGPGTFVMRQVVSHSALLDNWHIVFAGYWELCSPVEVG